MNPRLRLNLCVMMIFISAGYAVLVDIDTDLAEAVALGYIAFLLTMFAIVNVWKKT